LQSSPIGVPYGHRLSATCGKTASHSVSDDFDSIYSLADFNSDRTYGGIKELKT
jgi:hypothetical protein